MRFKRIVRFVLTIFIYSVECFRFPSVQDFKVLKIDPIVKDPMNDSDKYFLKTDRQNIS